VTELDQWPTDLDYLMFDVTTAGLQFAPPGRACVIGAGGGRDVLSALHTGATSVDAVELNPAIVEAMTGPFADYNGDVYGLPGVNPVVSEGRSFLTRSEGGYDAIMVSLVDSWAATAAGAYALSETYLYTLEAVALYWDRLSEQGIVSISRWYDTGKPGEALRIALTAREALERAGVESPLRHMALLQGGRVMTLVISRQPLAQEDVARIDSVATERGFLRHWPPLRSSDPMLVGALASDPPIYYIGGHDLSPVADDRPFFFQTVSPFQSLGDVDRDNFNFNDASIITLRVLIAAVTALTALLLLLPVLVRRRALGSGARSTGYFAAIGLAFMFVELAMIQRFILYLGHPSYATTVVIAAVLLGAGAGSALAGRVETDLVRKYSLALPIAVVVITLLATPIFAGTLGAATAVRILISVLLLLPLGLLMGFAFPTGMIHFPESGRAWYWAVNGTTSVLGSVLSLALAMLFGFQGVILLGAATYLMACALLGRETPQNSV